MGHTINVSVRNKIAVAPKDALYICGNSDFVVVFDFDDEWAGYDAKTARFRYNGTHQDIVFTGNECEVPIISNTYNIEVGVFAGDLRTTTPAYVSAKKSILCGGGVPEDPPEDVYNQIMELLETRPGGTVELDTTLTQKGMAADAGAVGTAINQLSSRKVDKQQGVENVGKVLGIGENGMVVPVDAPSGEGAVSYAEEQELTEEERERARENIDVAQKPLVVNITRDSWSVDMHTVSGAINQGRTVIGVLSAYLPEISGGDMTLNTQKVYDATGATGNWEEQRIRFEFETTEYNTKLFSDQWEGSRGGGTALYIKPMSATSTTYGNIKADPAEESDTVPARIGADGKLYVAQSRGTTGDYIPAPETATVGQTIQVTEVDEDGKPITWEAVDFPSGGGSGGNSGTEWTLVSTTTTTEDVGYVAIPMPETANELFAYMIVPGSSELTSEIRAIGWHKNGATMGAYEVVCGTVNGSEQHYCISGMRFGEYARMTQSLHLPYPANGQHKNYGGKRYKINNNYYFVVSTPYGNTKLPAGLTVDLYVR